MSDPSFSLSTPSNEQLPDPPASANNNSNSSDTVSRSRSNSSGPSPTTLPPASFKFGAPPRNPFADYAVPNIGSVFQTMASNAAPNKAAGLLSGLSGLKQLPAFKLKKAAEVKFTEVDLEHQFTMSIEDRIRFFDKYRKYIPIRSELAELNVSDDRLDLHKLPDILMLAGGNTGVRFTSAELMELSTLVRGPMQHHYDEMDVIFKSLTSHYRKLCLHTHTPTPTPGVGRGASPAAAAGGLPSLVSPEVPVTTEVIALLSPDANSSVVIEIPRTETVTHVVVNSDGQTVPVLPPSTELKPYNTNTSNSNSKSNSNASSEIVQPIATKLTPSVSFSSNFSVSSGSSASSTLSGESGHHEGSTTSGGSGQHKDQKDGLPKRKSFRVVDGPLSLSEEDALHLAANTKAAAASVSGSGSSRHNSFSSLSSSAVGDTPSSSSSSDVLSTAVAGGSDTASQQHSTVSSSTSTSTSNISTTPMPESTTCVSAEVPVPSLLSPASDLMSPVSNPDYDCYANLPEVLKFHTHADAYVAALKRVQTFVKDKQGEINKTAVKDTTPKTKDDAEGKGLKYPHWLSVLIHLYETVLDHTHTNVLGSPVNVAARIVAPSFNVKMPRNVDIIDVDDHPSVGTPMAGTPMAGTPIPENSSSSSSSNSSSSSSGSGSGLSVVTPQHLTPADAHHVSPKHQAAPLQRTPSKKASAFDDHGTTNNNNSSSSSSVCKPAKRKTQLTCGLLANLLSCCVFHKIEMTHEEFDALEEVLEASNDTTCVYYITNDYAHYAPAHTHIHPHTVVAGGGSPSKSPAKSPSKTSSKSPLKPLSLGGLPTAAAGAGAGVGAEGDLSARSGQSSARLSTNGGGQRSRAGSTLEDESVFAVLHAHGQKYWAKRFFEFVSKVVEIKSWPKDEKHLFEFDYFFTADD